MSEAGDYTPAPHWGGHDFASARRSYADKVVNAGPSLARVGLKKTDLVPEHLNTNSENPLIILCDLTGSMGEWPITIFSKLPYLEHEAKEYLGEDAEIAFGGIGDAFSDSYPLQMRPFAKKADLKESLEKLVHEKGGGGSSEESYDLAAVYLANHLECPNATRKPIIIFIGDEGVYSYVDRAMAEAHCKTTLEQNVSPAEIFKQLTAKNSVYIIRKPYGHDDNDPNSRNKAIERQWIGFLGAEYVLSLPDPNRVVDVIFGILAKESGKEDYFEKELVDRQMKDKDGKAKVDAVMKSLRTIHTKRSMKRLGSPDRAVSVTRGRETGGTKSISLLDDE